MEQSKLEHYTTVLNIPFIFNNSLFAGVELVQVYGVLVDQKETINICAVAFCTEISRDGTNVYKDLNLNQVVFITTKKRAEICYSSQCFQTVVCLIPQTTHSFQLIGIFNFF